MKNLTHITLTFAALVLVFSCVLEARAEPVVITEGFVGIGGALPPGFATFRATNYSLTGSNFTVSGFEGDGSQPDVFSPCIFAPCPAGTLINASSFIRLQGRGTATIDGITFDLTTTFGSPVTFTTPSVAIPSGGEIVTVTTPFTMIGESGIFTLPGGAQVFSTTAISGSGIATITLRAFEGGHVITSITYNFQAPIPEPATLLLFGTGVAGLATAAWRRRKSG